LISLLQVK